MPRKTRGEFDIGVGALSWIVLVLVFFCVGYTLTHAVLCLYKTFF